MLPPKQCIPQRYQVRIVPSHKSAFYLSPHPFRPENILLDSNFQLKLADFGLANITSDADTVLETECGTKSYMAPEIFEHQGYYGGSVDVWSAGVVLFIMLCGSPPFDIANGKDWWFKAVSVCLHLPPKFIYFNFFFFFAAKSL